MVHGLHTPVTLTRSLPLLKPPMDGIAPISTSPILPLIRRSSLSRPGSISPRTPDQYCYSAAFVTQRALLASPWWAWFPCLLVVVLVRLILTDPPAAPLWTVETPVGPASGLISLTVYVASMVLTRSPSRSGEGSSWWRLPAPVWGLPRIWASSRIRISPELSSFRATSVVVYPLVSLMSVVVPSPSADAILVLFSTLLSPVRSYSRPSCAICPA